MNRPNRKGIMYTIVVILLLFVIASMFFSTSRVSNTEAVAARVYTLDRFISDLEQDSNRAAYISGFRTLIAMEQHITSTGEPITSPGVAFREIFLEGSYAGTDFIIMENSTFNEYLSRVQYEAGKQGVTFNATISNVSLWQTDPWHILVNYTMEANVTDNRGTANWSITRNFTGKVPIVDVRDPLFTLHTYGRIQRVIKPSNVTDFVDDATNATAGLLEHFNNSQYLAAGRGPNIIMRFANNLSDDEFGIESLVDTEEFTAQNLPIAGTASVVDYQYFQGTVATVCSIQNLPSRIRLRASHIASYEVDELSYNAC